MLKIKLRINKKYKNACICLNENLSFFYLSCMLNRLI